MEFLFGFPAEHFSFEFMQIWNKFMDSLFTKKTKKYKTFFCIQIRNNFLIKFLITFSLFPNLFHLTLFTRASI